MEKRFLTAYILVFFERKIFNILVQYFFYFLFSFYNNYTALFDKRQRFDKVGTTDKVSDTNGLRIFVFHFSAPTRFLSLRLFPHTYERKYGLYKCAKIVICYDFYI